jgi:hypothetical protein
MKTALELIIEHIDARLASMSLPGAARMWGSGESLELQALQLLELRTLALRPYSFTADPREMRRAYMSFVAKKVKNPPSMLMWAILEQGNASTTLPAFIGDITRNVAQELPQDDPVSESPLALELQFSAAEEDVSFAKVCRYYYKFEESVTAVAKRQVSSREYKNRVSGTYFPVPDIRIVRKLGAGPRVQLPIGAPLGGDGHVSNFGPLAGKGAHEDLFMRGLDKTLELATWACSEDAISPDIAFNMFSNRKALNDVARKTFNIFPGQGIESVRVGGTYMNGSPVTVQAKYAHRMLELIDDEGRNEPFETVGTVDAVDYEQGWFRLKTREVCWLVFKDITVLMNVAKAASPDGLVHVKGTRHINAKGAVTRVDAITAELIKESTLAPKR